MKRENVRLLMEGLKRDRSRSSVRLVWRGSLRSEMVARSFEPVTMDEPKDIGGSDTAPRPTEYLLGAWIGCTSATTVIVANELGLEYRSLEARAVGDLDPRGVAGMPGISPGFFEARMKVIIDTDDPQGKVDLLAEQVAARCPVNAMMRKGCPSVEVKWEVASKGRVVEAAEKGST